MERKATNLAASFYFLFLSLVSLPSTTSRFMHQQKFHTVEVKALLPSHRCAVRKGWLVSKQSNSTLKLVDPHGPCSPFHSNSGLARDVEQGFEAILKRDESRVDWINSRRSSSSSYYGQVKSFLLTSDATTVPASSGIPLASANFIVNVSLGTPKQEFTLSVDTGSDLTWVQCEPCAVSCYPQRGPKFNPSASSTYQKIPCSAPECAEVKAESGLSGCSAGRCIYGITYADASLTIGFLSRETLTLGSADAQTGFMFGCGQDNNGTFGLEAGILGLGRTKFSLISQAANKYGGKFTYCLPQSNAPGYLTLGPEPSTYSTARFTPLITKPGQDPTFYYIAITGLSVGGQQLNVSSSVFESPGTFIDSGTAITRLPLTAYNALRTAFRSMMTKYPTSQPLGNFEICYDVSNYTVVDIPVITFHFEGGTDLALDADNIMLVTSTARACLAFLPTRSENTPAILGNWQQRTTEIVHDIANARIGFRPGACN